MKVALKAGKICLVQEEVDMCVRLMERAADFEGFLGKAAEAAGEEVDRKIANRLQSEYFVLRTTLVYDRASFLLSEAC